MTAGAHARSLLSAEGTGRAARPPGEAEVSLTCSALSEASTALPRALTLSLLQCCRRPRADCSAQPAGGRWDRA